MPRQNPKITQPSFSVLYFWFAMANNTKSIFPLKTHFDGQSTTESSSMWDVSGRVSGSLTEKEKNGFIIRKCLLLIHRFYRIIMTYTDYMVLLCVDVIKISWNYLALFTLLHHHRNYYYFRLISRFFSSSQCRLLFVLLIKFDKFLRHQHKQPVIKGQNMQFHLVLIFHLHSPYFGIWILSNKLSESYYIKKKVSLTIFLLD